MYKNYRDLLRAKVESLRGEGSSYRELATRCSLASPNYIQQVLIGRRNLRIATAKAIAKGLQMTPREKRLFVALVRLHQPDLAGTELALGDLRAATHEMQRLSVRDGSIHESWLNGVLFELAGLGGAPLTEKVALARLKGKATPQEINLALSSLANRGWLLRKGRPGEDFFVRGHVQFEPLDDTRRIDVQRSHLRFLDMAKHRINDGLDEREFRGVTVAIPMSAFERVREKIRECFEAISSLADEVGDADTVIRVQCCAFKVTV